MMRYFSLSYRRFASLLLAGVFLAVGCGSTEPDDPPDDSEPPPTFNLAHLDYLGETVQHGGETFRIVHIYADAPSYEWVGDDDEGIACVDDAARAAVVYLRHFEMTGAAASREKAEELLRFVMYMQRDNGLFYNFVWDNTLDINTTHPNSRADAFEWWAARGVWALGTGARVLATANPEFAAESAEHVRRTFPHLNALLDHYGETTTQGGRTLPRWLVGENAADATSELLLGLVALNEVSPDAELQTMIDRFAEGIALMQYGSMNTFPYGFHASYPGGWHGWGNSQTQALAEAGVTASAEREAEQFYPRLLVDGWLHSIPFSGDVRRFEQIAYATRCVTVGLLRLYEATGDERYATMAGLAASWFTGDNVADFAMYDAEHGRGYDGINGPDSVNLNSGAESTIEALFSVLEVERVPTARAWMTARGGEPVELDRDGKTYRYRLFTVGSGDAQQRVAVVMNLTDEHFQLLEGDALDALLNP